MLDIVVSFNKNNLKYTFSLPVRIAEDSKVDVILRLETIKKLNLVRIIPGFFQSPENIANEKMKSLKKTESLHKHGIKPRGRSTPARSRVGHSHKYYRANFTFGYN